jgi:excisionase family DNA binding protein
MEIRLVKVKEAAKYLSLSPWKVRQLVIVGTLPYIQLEERGPFLIDIRDLETFIKERKLRY